MTTLYDLVAGQNPYSKMALAILALERDLIPRYRDATLIQPAAAGDDWTVGLLTRTGGPNKTHFDTSTLDNHDLFLTCIDMPHDPTYAIYTMAFPAELSGLGKWIVSTETLEGDDRVDAWVSLFNKLNKLKEAYPKSPYVLSMKKWIAPVMQQLVDTDKVDIKDVN